MRSHARSMRSHARSRMSPMLVITLEELLSISLAHCHSWQDRTDCSVDAKINAFIKFLVRPFMHALDFVSSSPSPACSFTDRFETPSVNSNTANTTKTHYRENTPFPISYFPIPIFSDTLFVGNKAQLPTCLSVG